MKILEILSEHRNDFTARLVCEHCKQTQRLTSGYHDNHYHTQVIPAITCKSCHKDRSGRVGDNDNGTIPTQTWKEQHAIALPNVE